MLQFARRIRPLRQRTRGKHDPKSKGKQQKAAKLKEKKTEDRYLKGINERR
jgi:hypothetical protein